MRCGCEDGYDCTKTSVCAVESAVEDATDMMQGVVDAAIVFAHADLAAHHGPCGQIKRRALKNLHEEVEAYEEWEKDL